MNGVLHATLQHDEAVLRFPYDDRLRKLLRALPGRRWDPVERAWIVPLDPDRAQALTLLFTNLRRPPAISEPLMRALERRRRRRRHDAVLLDLARPADEWWLTFATDTAPAIGERLLEHPEAVELPMLERGLVPLDEHTAELVAELEECEGEALLSEDAEHALTELGRRFAGPAPHAGPAQHDGAGGATHSDDAGVLHFGGASFYAHGLPEPASVARRRRWHGTIDVDGPAGNPVFLLLGDRAHLPEELREQAASVPGGASLPLTLESWREIQKRLRAFTSAGARRCVAALEQGRPAPGAVLELSDLPQAEPTFLLAPGHSHAAVQAFAALPGATAAYRGATPALRADPFCVPDLDALLAEHDVWIEPDALAQLQRIREEHARAAGLVELSAATDAELDAPSLGGELKPFQRAGVSYLLSQRRAFLADEQGLGKTIEALAAVEADGAYPAIVLCPASLKLNWLREIERWLPHRRVRALHGTGGGACARDIPRNGEGPRRKAPPSDVSSADITVVNYDIAAAREDELAALAPRALVLDESHYCKNGAAKRTQAAARIATRVPADGLVLALTGTPVMNRPNELISQLRIIGRLADFGSGAQFGERFRGADAHHRLHWHLRARCFVRRLKSEVLPQLPAKTRAIVPVALDNEGEYRLAERDVIAWLRSRPLDLAELDAKVAAALRAERLVRLNALKLLAARGKLHAALAWIHDFLSTGERLVVFAGHREIQRAVVERFPHALHVLGEDSHQRRDAAVQRFQESEDSPQNQLIVCSTAVAGQGLTLTRASNVAFLELDWTPARHDQAEDRCIADGQLVHTRDRGFVPIESVKTGEQVMSHSGYWRRVHATCRRHHRGALTTVRYSRYSEPLVCTPDHRVLAMREGAEPQWREAHTLLPGDLLVMPRPTGVHVDEVEVPDGVSVSRSRSQTAFTEQQAHVLRREREDGVSAKELAAIYGVHATTLRRALRRTTWTQANGRAVRLPRSIALDDDMLFVIGWYLAEGFCSTVSGKGRFVSFSGHNREEQILYRIEQRLGLLGVKCSLYRSKKFQSIELRAYSAELARWFSQWFGKYCYNKRLPAELLNLSEHQSRVLLDAYVEGDGYKRRKQTEWVSASSTLASQFALIAARCGEAPTLRRVDTGKNAGQWVGGYTTDGAPSSDLLCRWTGEVVYNPVRSVTTQTVRDAFVNDLSVEQDESFVVGLASVHNCHRIGQQDAVNAWYLLAAGTIDETIATLLERKRAVIGAVTDGRPEQEEAVVDALARELASEPYRHLRSVA